MQHALVIGASGGIGRAISAELEARGWRVTGLSRSTDGLDVTDAASVTAHLSKLEGPFQRIIIATGALEIGNHRPEKALKHITSEAMAAQFALNATGPALVLAHTARLLPRDEAAVVATLSARVGSIGDNQIGGWHSYRAAKAAVNQIIRGAAIELSRTHKRAACVALHPGTVATKFTEKYLGRHPAVSAEQAAKRLLDVMDSLGPEQTGQFFDYAGKPVPW
ncbi:SDR family NAD(P)-dependent oxidoreductase [Roseibaca sp. V10]|uniref:SDR family NAD(P)-dependent oxidoreductase n=1 Tax=Roseinatronobacter domitianus TaxID=2940293 RepID=A0ABT0LZQ6_9RHOB|nr:SDR family NAD(P)-dependent oxidoreductase [Roseibaca domitiana]MCL1628083.1 SDR family NAD(P)-dependent oxidoreductase [Roseibaca domitiana]